MIIEDEQAHATHEAWKAFTALWEEIKVGGTPAFVQGPVFPEGTNWQLLLQLDSANLPFYVNFGYAFLSEDGTCGKFLWQDLQQLVRSIPCDEKSKNTLEKHGCEYKQLENGYVSVTFPENTTKTEIQPRVHTTRSRIILPDTYELQLDILPNDTTILGFPEDLVAMVKAEGMFRISYMFGSCSHAQLFLTGNAA